HLGILSAGAGGAVTSAPTKVSISRGSRRMGGTSRRARVAVITASESLVEVGGGAQWGKTRGPPTEIGEPGPVPWGRVNQPGAPAPPEPGGSGVGAPAHHSTPARGRVRAPEGRSDRLADRPGRTSGRLLAPVALELDRDPAGGMARGQR